jgi:hypothetical protein
MPVMKFWKITYLLMVIGGLMLNSGCSTARLEDELCDDLCTAHVQCGHETGYILGRFCDDADDRCSMDSCLIQCHQSLSEKGIGHKRLDEACSDLDPMLEAFACLYGEAALSCASLEIIAVEEGICQHEVQAADEACVNYRQSYLFW